jgi:hypothetical protein
MGLARSEIAAVGVIVASVLVTAAGFGFGSAAEPKPAPAPTTTAPPPLPEEEVPSTTPEPGGTGTGTGAVTEASPVTIVSVGPLTLGMTLEQVEELTGVDFEESGEAGCTTATAVGALAGLELVLVDGEVAVLTFGAGGYKTLSGIGIGATEQAVLSTYAGQIEQAESTLTFVPRDPEDAEYRIVFRTDGAAVTSYSAGLLPTVVEGCP